MKTIGLTFGEEPSPLTEDEERNLLRLLSLCQLAEPSGPLAEKLRTLERCGFITSGFHASGGYAARSLRLCSITPAGLARLHRLEEASQQRAQQQAQSHTAHDAQRAYLDQQAQKQFRHDWRIAVFEALAAFILGAVANHLIGIIG